ncbi:hypothetical protein [Clostridium isatidis]|uniref:Uncharacterized protein n=1 Tax=Clostridium isatidis TaxID=182773 RepID=A0A343JA92_9CLOT|nr:hypothetical protein [Clostridium isatidis]ASW42450.1 hypothetical protein BEN51_02825 [Clostridium isatidis]
MINKKRGKILSILFLLCIILIILINFPRGKEYTYVKTLSGNIGDLSDISEIKQTFYANEDNLYGVGIIFGKYMSKYTSDIEIKISDKDNNVITKEIINGKNIKEGKFTKIYFDPIMVSKGEEYSIYINSLDKDTEQKITIYSSLYNDYTYGDLYIDGDVKDFDISFMAEYKKSINSSIYEIISQMNLSPIYLIIIIVILFTSLFNLINIINNLISEER